MTSAYPPVPEAAEAGEGLSLLIQDIPGVIQEVSIVTAAGDPALGQQLLSRVVPDQGDWVKQVIEVHRRGLGLLDHRQQLLYRVGGAPEDEA
jgi:hypothetical protein